MIARNLVCHDGDLLSHDADYSGIHDDDEGKELRIDDVKEVWLLGRVAAVGDRHNREAVLGV